MAHVKPSHLYRTICDRAMYSSMPRRKPANKRPTSVLQSISGSKSSKLPGSPGRSNGGSAGHGTPSKAADSRTGQIPPKDINSPSLNRDTHHRFGAGASRTDPIPPQTRPQMIWRGMENSPAYKSAARKWVASIIALPIFIVTSYFLFDRLMLGVRAKDAPSGTGTRMSARREGDS
ncbi:hypothetical protein VUR80DRAFT_7711 [Thermomyces stellatus]